MSGKQIALYVLSYVFAPITGALLAIGYWFTYPSLCKKKNGAKKEIKEG